MKPLELVRRARGAINCRADDVSHLDGGCANSGRSCVNENALAQVEVGPRKKRIVCGDINFRNRARLHQVQLRRNTSEITLRHADKLGMRAAAGYSTNAIADLPSANLLADWFHFASGL